MFVMVFAPNGARVLLNLDLSFAITEDQAGLASAISNAGHVVALGVKLDVIASELLGQLPEDEEAEK